MTRAERAWAAVLAAGSAALALHPHYETDLYWHLALGRAVLEARSRVVPEPMALPVFGARCTASEWLWELLALGLYRAGGVAVVAALVALCAAVAALGVAGCVGATREGEGASDEGSGALRFGARALVSGAVVALVSTRLRLRPEAAVMALMPFFVLLAVRQVRAFEAGAGRAAGRLGVALVALEVLWAQVHPSFVLAAVTWVFAVGPCLARSRAMPRGAVLTGAGLLLGLASSAHGVGIVHQWWRHAAGDAVRHIGDMQAPPWDFFNPASTVGGPVVLLLLGLGVAGMLAARRVFVAELALAVPGVALVATAVRGVGPGALLMGPLAFRGALALGVLCAGAGSRRRAWGVAGIGAVMGVGALLFAAARLDPDERPFGAVGMQPGALPHLSARWLARAPVGTPVLTTFLAGAPLGFWLRGRVRTLIDSRAPMFFGDADYARARDLWRTGPVLERAALRHGFAAAVVERATPTCALLAASPRWRPVVIEAGYTAFARVGGRFDAVGPLRALAPCGEDYLLPGACGDDRGALLGGEIGRLRGLGARQAEPFLRYLEAERVVRCGQRGVGLERVLAALEGERDAWAFRPARDRLLGRVLVAAGRLDAAYGVLAPRARAGDLLAFGILFEPLADRRDPRLVELLRVMARVLDDATPGDLRAELAARCAGAGDAECARFHGLRAAGQGSARAGPALCWLSTRHPLASVRSDASAWLALLRAERDDARLRCP